VSFGPEGVALGEIESLYRTRLAVFRRVARGVVGDPDAARDAVQDAFAQVVRNRASFRGEGSLEGWVWKTVLNSARMQRRAAGTKARLLLDEPETVSNGHSPDADLRVRAAIAALPERQRLIVFLRYFADLDYASIADILDISPGTVAATLSNAHSAIQRLLPEVQE
jgi:RNA polymerase sigma-70 factor (ECF subfamily)